MSSFRLYFRDVVNTSNVTIKIIQIKLCRFFATYNVYFKSFYCISWSPVDDTEKKSKILNFQI